MTRHNRRSNRRPSRLRAPSLPLSAFLAIALLGFGCSLSQSSDSLSNSISSPFESSSSFSDGEKSAYRRDVEAYTLAFVESSTDIGEMELAEFQRGIGHLAVESGITHWEADALTCASIGSGLGKAGMNLEQAAAFGRQLFANNGDALDAVTNGHRNEIHNTL
jgi:hypothetical protein